jgi:16S rRNA (cytosine1402-N4)-methyltransferase
MDRDPVALAHAEATLASRGVLAKPTLTVVFAQASFREVRSVLNAHGLSAADAFLLDLGFSSDTLFRGRGFSFRPDARKEPLDMRYDPGEACPTAAMLLARTNERSLAALLREYGEERYASRIARAIVTARRRAPIATVGDLIDVVVRALPPAARRGATHAATKTFQSVRMAVNRELDHLEAVLDEAPLALASGGRMAVITFHSVEDRVVKRSFVVYAKIERGTILTPTPVVPSREEVRQNPKSRSAKLRAFEFSRL